MDGRAPGHILELRSLLRGPPARVFETLTDPPALASWWGPRGFTTPSIAIDLRIGGTYRFAMQPPEGELFHLTGRFREVDPPRRLVYTFRWEEPDPDDQDTLVELSLHAVSDDTELALRHVQFATRARLELHRQGWAESLEKLAALIDAGPPTGS